MEKQDLLLKASTDASFTKNITRFFPEVLQNLKISIPFLHPHLQQNITQCMSTNSDLLT